MVEELNLTMVGVLPCENKDLREEKGSLCYVLGVDNNCP